MRSIYTETGNSRAGLEPCATDTRRVAVAQAYDPTRVVQPFRALALPEAVELPVLGSDHDAAPCDGGRGRQRRADIKLPQFVATFDIENVQPSIVRANVDSPIGGRR